MPRRLSLLSFAAGALALSWQVQAQAQTAPSTVPPLTADASQVTRQAPSVAAPRKGSLPADPVASAQSGKGGKASPAAKASQGKASTKGAKGAKTAKAGQGHGKKAPKSGQAHGQGKGKKAAH